MYSLNKSILKDIGRVFRDLELSEMNYRRPEFIINAELDTKITMWLCLSAICHNTRSLSGYIDATFYKGWDYLSTKFSYLAETNPLFFEPSNLSMLISSELKESLKDDRNNLSLENLDKRTDYLVDIGYILMRYFDSDPCEIISQSNGFAIKPDGNGLYQLLEKFQAFQDPERKKATIFLMLLNDSGTMKIKDIEHVEPIVDYHIMRGLLRTGAIVVEEDIHDILKSYKQISPEIERNIRKISKQAVRYISNISGKNVFQLNWLMWNLFRSCCYKELCCKKCQIINQKKNYCSFTASVQYICGNKCPLSSVCLGAKRPEYSSLWEPLIDTDYY